MTSPGVSISPSADWCLVVGETVMLGDACVRGTPEPLKLWRMQHSLTQLRTSLSSPEFCCKSPVFIFFGGMSPNYI